MENFYSYLNSSPHFDKIKYNDLTFIEYTCPINQEYAPIWTPHDYVVHVISGKKTWHTIEGKVTLQPGDTAYIKKGGHIVHQHFEDNFCLLLFFVTDEVKKELLLTEASRHKQGKLDTASTIIHFIKSNTLLYAFFLSIRSFFKMNKPPSDEIKKLKIQEFAHILSIEPENYQTLQNLFSVEHYSVERLKSIMSQNYMYNLSLHEFAELCNRSVSSFRRDFIKCYGTTLSKWLHNKRLDLASSLLIHTTFSISQIALESGFANLSHFSQNFKERFHCTPSEYRKHQTLTTTEQ